MKSLYVRLLIGMWATMTLLLVAFALIHAWTFPRESPHLRTVVRRAMTFRAEHWMTCHANAQEDCDTVLEAVDARDQRIAIYRGSELVAGQAIDGAPALVEEVGRAADPFAFERRGDSDLMALRLAGERGDLTAVGAQPVASRWLFFVVPETLPYRLASIVLITGLISALLARYLSRPLRVLRDAAARFGSGDLKSRVGPSLGAADAEVLALGAEMDRMAERIEALLEGQHRLLRDVSHELRSPLARLGLALELVRRKSPAELWPTLDRIEREADRLNSMIGELLTLSRLESGAPLDRKEDFDVAEIVREVVDDAAFEAGESGVVVALDSAGAAVAHGNRELLRRAVENVLRNALRYTPKGSTVEVSLHECAPRATEIVVRDHGPGVPEDATETIFKPFYRVDTDRDRKRGGAGLGLAIASGAITIHGGSITASNHPEGGLVVRMTVPSRSRERKSDPIRLQP
ncbi:MAG: ATP-binding protein [Polyangiaceae bacterium]